MKAFQHDLFLLRKFNYTGFTVCTFELNKKKYQTQAYNIVIVLSLILMGALTLIMFVLIHV